MAPLVAQRNYLFETFLVRMSKLPVIFENDDYVIVNKGPGMLSIPDRFHPEWPSALGLLKKNYESIWVVHRIDRDTSGCLCFAKNAEAHRHASMQFEKRLVVKIYEAIVHGTPSEEHGYIDAPMMEHPTIKGKMIVHAKLGKPAQTTYDVVTSYGLFSHVRYTLHTGRTHQIRVHSNHIGCPIVCDNVYGNGEPVYISSLKRTYKLAKLDEEERPMLQRLALHAAALSFTDEHGNTIRAEASLPKDMQAFLNQCKKWLKPLK